MGYVSEMICGLCVSIMTRMLPIMSLDYVSHYYPHDLLTGKACIGVVICSNKKSHKVINMAALQMSLSSAALGGNVHGTNLEQSCTKGSSSLLAGEYVGLKMLPSLRASSFATRAMPVHSAQSHTLK